MVLYYVALVDCGAVRRVISLRRISSATGGKFANGAASAAMGYVLSTARSGREGEWIFPEGGSTDLNDYDTVMTNGILGDRSEFMKALTANPTAAGYFNPSHSFFGDLMESFGQKFFGWAGDPLAAEFARGMAGVNHPMTWLALTCVGVR